MTNRLSRFRLALSPSPAQIQNIPFSGVSILIARTALIALAALAASGCAARHARKEAPARGERQVPGSHAEGPRVPKNVPGEYLHFENAIVKPGDPAPDFTLPSYAGDGEVSLSSFLGKPVVLVFGSYTCDRFRGVAGEVVRLQQEFGDRVEFVMVYVREAHASNEWVRRQNEAAGIAVAQPETFDERRAVAGQCVSALALPFTTLVDGLDDAVSKVYGGWPNRLYVIDRRGRIAYQSGAGPAGFIPSEVRTVLEKKLGGHRG